MWKTVALSGGFQRDRKVMESKNIERGCRLEWLPMYLPSLHSARLPTHYGELEVNFKSRF